jgi:hypothetical protein
MYSLVVIASRGKNIQIRGTCALMERVLPSPTILLNSTEIVTHRSGSSNRGMSGSTWIVFKRKRQNRASLGFCFVL